MHEILKQIIINNSNFINNTATDGGAIYWEGTNGTENSCNFINNTAESDGGAIYWFGANGTISDSNFINNNATTNGGAIYFNDAASPNNCALVNNIAPTGSEIYIYTGNPNLNYNWWSSNNPNWVNLINGSYVLSVYAVLNVTAEPSEIFTSEKSNITTKFVWNGTNTDATNLLPKRNVKLSSNGTLTETEGDVGLISEFSASTEGSYFVNATVDDETYNPTSTTVKIEVMPKSDIIILADNVTKYYHGLQRFVVTVSSTYGIHIAGISVNIIINGMTYTRVTGGNGATSIPLNLNSGEYGVTVVVENNTVNSVVTILSTVNGSDIVKMYRNGTHYYATFLDSQGNFLADGTAVRFNINGVMYDRKVSGGKGQAKLNINLEEGEYIITAINPETGENTANNITVLSLLTENKDITKYYRNASQYTVKVLGENGNPVGAGKTVKFNSMA